MNIDSSPTKLHGVVDGIVYQHQERIDELNDRIASRQFADFPLEPNYDPRPLSTKYTHFHLVDSSPKSSTTSSIQYPPYQVGANFNPGSDRAPPSGYSTTVDLESVLRNQTIAIQRGADQGVYVPTTNSDLYNVSITSRPSNQPFPSMFVPPQFSQSPHPNLSPAIGQDRFFNHTRTQLRNSN
jgi:hypothetical protein